MSGRPTVQIRHIKDKADLLLRYSSRVASCNALDVINMGKAGHIMSKTTQAEGPASYDLYLKGLTVRRLSSQESGSRPDTPKYLSRSGASAHCDNTSENFISANQIDE